MLRNKCISVVFTVMIFIGLHVGSTPALADWKVIDLGTLGGGQSEAHDINNLGYIIGSAHNGTTMKPFVWNNNLMTEIAGNNTNDSNSVLTSVSSINNKSQIVGQMLTKVDGIYNYVSHPAIWDNGVLIDLYPESYTSITMTSINDDGQSVGNLMDNYGNQNAMLWSNGQFVPLGTLPDMTQSYAYAINNIGQVVGTSSFYSWWDPSKRIARPFLWSNGAMVDLGTLGGSKSHAFSINDSGQAVGFSSIAANNLEHATLWSNGTIQDLGVLPNYSFSYANDINNKGQIVGTSTKDYQGKGCATLWENGSVIDLNSLIAGSGWYLLDARGINDKGQIVGYGYNPEGFTRGYLLIPNDDLKEDVDSVPPVSTIIYPSNGDYIRGNVTTVAGTASDNSSEIATVEVSLDNGAHWAAVSGTTNWSYNWGLPSDGIYTIKSKATDSSGNVQSALSTVAVSVDNTPPDITVTGITKDVAYVVGGVPAAGYTVTDNLSGVASHNATLTGGNSKGVGTLVYTVSATDKAGNSRTVDTTYFVKYNSGGFLAPLNLGKPFKLGSTIPVKFQLTDAAGKYISSATATISLQKYSGEEPVGDPIDAISTNGADSGNNFRYSSTDNLYIFNLDTKGLSVGTWQIRVTLDDGTVQSGSISLK